MSAIGGSESHIYPPEPPPRPSLEKKEGEKHLYVEMDGGLWLVIKTPKKEAQNERKCP